MPPPSWRDWKVSGSTFLDKDHVISTAKHFLGDGSTDGGRDQGDSLVSEADLIRLHAGRLYPSHRCRHTVNYGILQFVARCQDACQ